ncbi:MAG: YidC/Oxa1 family insertase periplasmic-domain containing protein, partial [Fimbriiglobus sp.]
TSQKMHLIPGFHRPRSAASLTELHKTPALGVVPDLPTGVVSDPAIRDALAEPSYVVLHYPAKDDPARQPDDAKVMNDGHPSTELGDRQWALKETGRDAQTGTWSAAFETDLGTPYFLRLRKTYSLGPKDYHFGLKFDVTPLEGRAAGKGVFRYQIVGPHGLPVEGEWYSSIFRNVMAGWTTPAGGVKRSFDDAASIHARYGGDKVLRSGNTFDYAAVATQYFASAVAIDDGQSGQDKDVAKAREDMWDFVRATREPGPTDDPLQPNLMDVTVRVVARPLDLRPGESASHQYVIYNGPVKVGLLRQLTGDRAVPDETVDRYLNKLSLRTMSDYHSPHFFGRLANSLFWTDIIIFFTNLMHSILGFLHNNVVAVWGVDIILLTVMVRLLLFGPSRRQQMAMAKMQAKTAQLKPEIDKLKEKYKDDFHRFNQERTKLMMENGANPLSAMGGCVLLFAQMPVLMGLYFCLQESVFFRLEPFLWVPNLAAPDMLAWWSESIPVLSDPGNMSHQSFFSFLYLGPFLNILPFISVALIFLHQMKTLPPPTDEQQEMQQKMMKYMVLMMAVFFYKVPAGLCVYFICGTLWALMERQFIPKPVLPPLGAVSLPGKPGPDAPSGGGGGSKSPPPTPPAGGGGFMG